MTVSSSLSLFRRSLTGYWNIKSKRYTGSQQRISRAVHLARSSPEQGCLHRERRVGNHNPRCSSGGHLPFASRICGRGRARPRRDICGCRWGSGGSACAVVHVDRRSPPPTRPRALSVPTAMEHNIRPLATIAAGSHHKCHCRVGICDVTSRAVVHGQPSDVPLKQQAQ